MPEESNGFDSVKRFAAAVMACVLALAMIIALILFIYAGFKTVGRGQARADAKNRVKISAIEIQNQAQRVTVAQQKAEIRKQDAIGVREAQDEIAKTLTPLYVQYEMTQAIMQIATSGKNNSVIYIPAGAGGIPLVDNVGTNQVGNPATEGG